MRITTLLLALALLLAPGCAVTGNPRTAEEVARWQASLTYWRDQVTVIRQQLENPPPGTDLLDDTTRRGLVDALAYADWYAKLFAGLVGNALNQAVPVVPSPAK
jgi:hypothetical protein